MPNRSRPDVLVPGRVAPDRTAPALTLVDGFVSALPSLARPARSPSAPVVASPSSVAGPSRGGRPGVAGRRVDAPALPAPRGAAVAVAELTRGAMPALARLDVPIQRISLGTLAVEALGADEGARLAVTGWSRDMATLHRVLAGLHRMA